MSMTIAQAKSELMQIYGALSPNKQQAIDTLVNIEPCEDAIRRQAVLDAITANCIWENEYNLTSSRIKKAVESLPSVNPQELKTGHWIISPNDCFVHCSECGLHGDKGIYKHYRWCPKCGAKMESEVRNE